MHFLGFVVVDEPTRAAVEQVLAPFEGEHWDWFRAGGRWDGYFKGEDEMKRRETHNGFNFDPANDCVESNAVLLKDVPANKFTPYFVAFDGQWHERETYRADVPNPEYPNSGIGSLVKNPNWEELLKILKETFPNRYVVVVDIHN